MVRESSHTRDKRACALGMWAGERGWMGWEECREEGDNGLELTHMYLFLVWGMMRFQTFLRSV